jgi:hypothetical protein
MLLGPIIVFVIFGAFAFMGIGVGNIGKGEKDPEADTPEETPKKENNVCHNMVSRLQVQ